MQHRPHPWREHSGARRLLAGLGGAALLAAGLTPAVAADPTEERTLGTASEHGVEHPVTAETPEGVTAVPNSWFVQLQGQPTAAGGTVSQVRATQRAFEREARSLGAEVAVAERFGTAWQGVTVRGSEAQVRKAAGASQVEAVFPVTVVEAPEPLEGERPDLTFATAMTGADIAQSELGLTGEGVKVAVMDTGVDYDHPDFGGNGSPDSTEFPTERVAYGYDFVGDDYNADASSDSYQPEPNPDGDPDDCQGHGTHVAGIVGANGELTGVAPEVTLGAYRVFGCDGSTTSDIMLQAMERAYQDGMDVLNMSIGSAFATWPQYPTAVGSDNLVDAGMVVVASIGNSGAAGTWSAGAPGVGEKVIGVASFDNTHFEANAFTVTVDGEEVAVPYVVGSPAPEPPTSGTATLSRLGDPGSTAAQLCSPTEQDLSGTVVLVERGGCTFHLKGVHAQQAGAAGVILYNNAPGIVNPSLTGEPPVEIPYASIFAEDGQLLDDLVTSGETEITWTDQTVVAPSPTGGLISSFSSYGMTAELDLKPDIGAPGGNINAPYPLEQGGYAVLSGTSMAAPHTAGAVALLLEERPDTAPEDVRPILQNSADPAPWSLAPSAGFPEPVHRQGAGMLDIDDAVLATTSVSPGKLSLGESVEGGHEVTLTLRNDGDSDVTYAVGEQGGVATGGNPNDPTFYGPLATVDGPESVTVPAGGSADVTLTIHDSGEDVLAQYGGWISFTAEDAPQLRVPYAGFDGDYQDVSLLDHAVFPTMATLTGCDRFIGVDCVKDGSWSLPEEGETPTYSMEDGDVPTALVHLVHPAQRATFRVYHATEDGTKGRPVHKVFSVAMAEQFLGRSGGPNAFTAWAWDGTRSHNHGNDKRKQVPDGDYVLELTVVNALGDAGNPEHVETWTSSSFTIDRPDDGGPGKGYGKGKG
ncbi:S8 family serine peptidase [Ornithinicoccus halotolerans]|uniref:S8 family serine peptidase n=1 Tax=Ornithinicoccus halotolerans TaxID=1748220 RepID=UPI001296D5D8|nr:S8 family serine peptidase [Ornithinicoccus halotolerans]